MGKGFATALSALVLSAGLTSAQTLPAPELAGQSVEPVVGGLTCDTSAPAAPQVWLSADYLLWWIKAAPNPVPLVTTGPFNPDTFTGTPIPAALGTPGTQVLFGGKDVDFGALSGLRLQGGINLDADGVFGVEGGAFLLEQAAHTFTAHSDAAGNPFLALPFRNALSGLEGINPISFPSDTAMVFGGQTGGISIATTSRLWGGEANVTLNLLNDAGFRLTGLLGFRYLDLDETMDLEAIYTPLFVGLPFNAPLPFANPGDQVSLGDGFHTRNQFYGGQVGGRVDYTLGMIDVALTAKVALGSTQERLDIGGFSTVQAAGMAPVTVPGGIFTTLSNSGTYHHSEFGVVPEVGLNVSFQLTPWLRAQVGYSFLYWSAVVRPGNTIDRTLDQAGIPTAPTYVPGFVGARPVPLLQQSDFWAQGINLGLELRF